MDGSSSGRSHYARLADDGGGGATPVVHLEPLPVQYTTLAPLRFVLALFYDENDLELVQKFAYSQELDRKLLANSVIGLGFTLMGVPFGLSSTLNIALVDGGNVTILYGWLLVSFFSYMVVLSMSEIISKYPTAGGVYHWSAILAPARYSMFASWLTAWLLVIGSWAYSASIMYGGLQFIVGLFNLGRARHHESDVYLVLGVYFLMVLVCGIINYTMAKQLELINRACIVWLLYTVLAIDVLLIFFSKHRNSMHDIFTKFDNSRLGWPDTVAFLVGLQALSFALSGYGMIFSICDEVRKPEKNMPRGTVRAILLAGAMGLGFILPILVIMPDPRLILDLGLDLGIVPIDMVFMVATELYVVSFLLAMLLVGTVLFQAIGSLTTALRTTWAFARDGGLPWLSVFALVTSRNEYLVPRNALLLSMVVPSILALLSLFSSSALNAFMGASVVALAIANGIPIMCSMLGGRRLVRGAAYPLKKIGWLVNVLSVLWLVLLLVILCAPPAIKDLRWSSMNYALVVLVFFCGVAIVGFYTWGRGNFHGPQIDTAYYLMDRQELSRGGSGGGDAEGEGAGEGEEGVKDGLDLIHGKPESTHERLLGANAR